MSDGRPQGWIKLQGVAGQWGLGGEWVEGERWACG
jgi:hypothetical protein